MQTAQISKDLSLAINFLEDLLNNKDSEAVIETIKKYKQMKTSDSLNMGNFSLE